MTSSPASVTTLRAKTPGDLLAVVPWVLGFHPQQSLVLLSLGSAPDRFHARVDLPFDETGLDEVVHLLSSVVRRSGASRLALVVYCDDHALALSAADELTAALEDGGASVVEALRADGTRWFPLPRQEDDRRGSSRAGVPQGRPYDVSSHPFTAQAVLDGRVTYRTREQLAASIGPLAVAATGPVAQAAQAALEVLHALHAPHATPAARRSGLREHRRHEGRWVQATLEEHLSDRSPVCAEDAGRMLVAITDIDIRDVAWAAMTRENASGHLDIWRDLVRLSPHHLAAAPAALLGFAAWLTGNGALAWCAVERCEEADPDYRLAELLGTALSNAVPPSTWRPLEESALLLFADDSADEEVDKEVDEAAG